MNARGVSHSMIHRIARTERVWTASNKHSYSYDYECLIATHGCIYTPKPMAIAKRQQLTRTVKAQRHCRNCDSYIHTTMQNSVKHTNS